MFSFTFLASFFSSGAENRNIKCHSVVGARYIYILFIGININVIIFNKNELIIKEINLYNKLNNLVQLIWSTHSANS